MALDKTFFTHPATKVAGCMAVPRSAPGVFPSNVAVLAIEEFRKEFPELAEHFDVLRAAASTRGPASGDTAPAAGVPELVTPPSNTGVNKTLSLAQGVK